MFSNVFRKIEPFMWQNMVDRREEPDNKIIRRIRYACWIPETTDYRLQTTDYSRTLLSNVSFLIYVALSSILH
jgi:hypothetical protein